jgi:hypothetical protein
VDVSGRFRFKVVYRALPVDSASASVYVYDAEHGDRLLQEGRYHAPFANGALEPGFGFTGKQLVYSANNRELGYSCELGVR